MAELPFPKLTEEQVTELIFNASQFGLANGLVMYPPPPFHNYAPTLAPITLYPTPFPREEFKRSLDIAKTYNKLYANIVSERKWLLDIVKDLSISDKDFTGKLYSCYLDAEKNGIPQDVSLALIRSDYMYDEQTRVIKQVEFNTVSVSFAGLSSKVGKLHSFLNSTGQYSSEGTVNYYQPEDLPVSESAVGMAKGLYSGVKYYNDTYLNGENKSIVLFVVQPNERNAFDQRSLELPLLSEFNVISKRIDLPEVSKSVKIDSTSKKLFYKGFEVSVVYYRSAYGPSEFQNAETWECRTMLESTMAIKCPSLLTQLSGAKKIQQLLTNDKHLLTFVNKEETLALKETFCKIHPLDFSAQGQLAKELAFNEPHKYVLKPQREGGGNNIYKEDIPGFLRSIPEKDWEGYILMELIHPKTHNNVILRNGELLKDGIVSELGIFGSYLVNEKSGDILSNETHGHLLRSKTSTSNEGGVAAGYGCVDNLYLY